MADYFAQLTNCALPSKAPVQLAVDGFAIELTQVPGLPTNRGDLRGQSGHTTDVLVRNVAEADVPRLRDVLDHVVDLLAFATESRVARYGEEYPRGSGLFSRRSVVGTVQSWRPPFDYNPDIKRFVELCYPRYRLHRDPRKLHVVIDYIHHSVFQGLADEVKIALACVTFECLRHTWAALDGYPFIDGSFRKKTATASNPGKNVSLRQHLREMFMQVGVLHAAADAEAVRIVDIRNEVVHTGLFQAVHNREHYEFLETSLRTYFLRLTGFTGQFYAYVGGSPAPVTI